MGDQMKVRYLGKGSPMTLTNNQIYEVQAVEGKFYQIVDDTGKEYLYLIDDSGLVEE